MVCNLENPNRSHEIKEFTAYIIVVIRNNNNDVTKMFCESITPLGAHVFHNNIYTLQMLTNDMHITIIIVTRDRRRAYDTPAACCILYILCNLFNGGRRFWTRTPEYRMDCDRFRERDRVFPQTDNAS